jgi:hypothetical protein
VGERGAGGRAARLVVGPVQEATADPLTSQGRIHLQLGHVEAPLGGGKSTRRRARSRGNDQTREPGQTQRQAQVGERHVHALADRALENSHHPTVDLGNDGRLGRIGDVVELDEPFAEGRCEATVADEADCFGAWLALDDLRDADNIHYARGLMVTSLTRHIVLD